MYEGRHETVFSDLAFHKDILDSLTANIAILDAQGTIVAVNASWQSFGRANDLQDADFGVGANYLVVCREAMVDPDARAAHDGIRDVLSGVRDSFYCEYPCHSPWEQRWFALRATPLAHYPHFVVVAHENITERVMAERASNPMAADVATQRDSAMSGSPVQASETQRLAALARYHALDTLPDAVFDHIAAAAAAFCETPIALISLIDAERQWFKSAIGIQLAEIPRDIAFCSHAIENPTEMMEVHDATRDTRFKDNPLVRDHPDIRFYAGRPLVTPDGHALGTLCVIDRVAKTLTPSQRQGLDHLAGAVVALFEERLRAPLTPVGRVIEDRLSNGIVITDASRQDQPIIYCNRGFETLTGYDRGEVLGKNCRLLQGTRTDSGDVAKLRRAIERGEEVTVTIRNYRKDGTPFWNQVTVSPVQNVEGRITHFFGLHQDVTQQRTAEERVTGLGSVVEASINEVYLFDESSLHFIHVNQGARNNLGYTMEELRALTPVDIKPEFTREKFQAFIKPLRDNERQKIDFMTTHRRKDGSTYPVEVHLQRANYDATPVFAAIILDITERTQNEEALAQARLFLESAPDATIIVNESGKVEVANSQTVRLFGYTLDELIGMPVETLMPKRYRAGHTAHRKAYTAKPKVRSMGIDMDLCAITKGGREIPIEVSLSPIQTGDAQMLVAATIRDVTTRKETDEALRRAKEVAESAAATKSRFLAAASHDLRQPLQSIGLYLSVLNHQLDDPGKAANVCEKIRSSLDVMGELLDALLDVSKLDSGSITPKRKDFSTQTLFEKLTTDNEPHAQRKGIDFFCSGTPCVVHSDPALLQRVVENFVTNAIRYTETGGVEVHSSGQDGHARIEVRDTGVGIPADSLDTIFEEYFQLDNHVRDRRKGLGLGLSIVKHIARLLDHRVEVTSEPGKGSVFAVEVPLGQQVEQAASAPTVARAPRVKTKVPVVLFVDDDPAIVDATTMLLGVSGFEVHSALNGDDALAVIEEGIRPDILVSDYRLPGYNGVEVVRRVRRALGDDLPTVLMTGDTSGREIEQANLDQCTVLHKPIDTEQLISLMESLVA